MDGHARIGTSGGKMSPSPGKSATAQPTNQGLATLIVMICVLTIIVLFCCFSAPGIRDLCKRYVFRTCEVDDPDRDNVFTRRYGQDTLYVISESPKKKQVQDFQGNTRAESTTPTLILLPNGRMLVVDRNVFVQLNADDTGIDLMELSANVLRSGTTQPPPGFGSLPSILDSETTSKGGLPSPASFVLSPPAYDDIFGGGVSDLPPSYSQLSLVCRQTDIEMNAVPDAGSACRADGVDDGSGDDDGGGGDGAETYDDTENAENGCVVDESSV